MEKKTSKKNKGKVIFLSVDFLIFLSKKNGSE